MKKTLITAADQSRASLAYSAKQNKIVRISRGIYATNAYYDLLEVYSMRYPKAIYTMHTLFSLYGMTDQFIDQYWLVTPRGSRTIQDEHIVQMRQMDEYIDIGKTTLLHNGRTINVYDKERLLIELFRSPNLVSKSIYREVINYYRKIVYDDFDMNRFTDYCSQFKQEKGLNDKFTKEIL